MFIGIIQGTAKVIDLTRSAGAARLKLELPAERARELKIGGSISVDGVCLTITEIQNTQVIFDLMSQTLNLSTLGQLKIGAYVNFERAAKLGEEIGGHILSGHVDGIVTVESIEKLEGNTTICLHVPAPLMPYIFPQGYIAINGASLTVAHVDSKNRTFKIGLIPETLKRTTFSQISIGDKLNLELDRITQIVVNTVNERLRSSTQ